MAVFNLAVTYPDGEGARIMTALKAHYGVVTNADAQEAFRKEVVARLKTVVLHEERKTALSGVAETSPS